MKMRRKFTTWIQKPLGFLAITVLSRSALANDLLAKSLDGDVQDSLGSNAAFWKIFTFVSIVLATAAAVKTHNPMVFAGVLAVSFIPAFLIKTFVF